MSFARDRARRREQGLPALTLIPYAKLQAQFNAACAVEGYVRPMGAADAAVMAHMQPMLESVRCAACQKRVFPLTIGDKPEAVTLEDFCSCEDGPAHHLLANAVLDEDEASLSRVVAEHEGKCKVCYGAGVYSHGANAADGYPDPAEVCEVCQGTGVANAH